jgi:hypothetical protein
LTVNARDTDGANALSFEGSDTGEISDGKTTVASGLLVRGTIEEAHGEIQTAVFDEATVAGSPAERIGGSSCSRTEVPQSVGT